MNSLRNITSVFMLIIVLISVLGIVSASLENWTFVVILLFAGFILSTMTVLAAFRLSLRHSRTGEKHTLVTTQKLSARVREYERASIKRVADLHKAMQSSHRNVRRFGEQADRKITLLNQSLQSIQKENRRHITNTVLHNTKQMESLIQLYSRFPDLKMPMPSTGGWAIDGQSLAHLVTLFQEHRPKSILELGSGTSTVWLGYLCRESGSTVVTLDHLEDYLLQTRTAIERHGLREVVDSRLAPLEALECNGKSFKWYSKAVLSDLEQIDMLLVDGPPAATGPLARYPALPELFDKLSSNAVIILDDIVREDEQQTIQEWLDLFPDFTVIEEATSGLAVLQRNI